jgi:NAD(P)-dependent dehydrogenase (short-subunit alcohol dehydrogenase family)
VARIIAKTGISEEQAMEHLRAASPQGRLMTPEEVAWLVARLCEPAAAGINGQALVIDGGGVQG